MIFFFFQFPDGILSFASLNLGFDNLNTVDLHFLLFASVHLVEGTSVPVCFLAAQPYDLFVSKPTGATPASWMIDAFLYFYGREESEV